MPTWSLSSFAAQSKRGPEPPAAVHPEAVCIAYAFETHGVFPGSHFPGGADKPSFRNELGLVLIPMEKYNSEVAKAMKASELALRKDME